DHNRSVYTLAGQDHGTALADALTAGARAALERLDIGTHEGLHPHVGTLDVAPIVYLAPEQRGAACAQALVLAERLGGELEIPVFIYGELGGGLTRAEVRRGGPHELARRIEAGELTPAFGPAHMHPRAGAVLVGARPPLIAFNVELGPPATLETARAVAALIREGGSEGLWGVRAIGLTLAHRGGVAQVSTNIEDHTRTSPAQVLNAIARHARPLCAEVIGLPPRAAFADFPAQLPVRNLRFLEDALAQAENH
ncbi:MAG TPA: hypothetical protein VKV16_00935, partial [Solirubrobacteraceae bacterium]|nr:hypothetical protein [Solirubrobacteraceae bacterium]